MLDKDFEEIGPSTSMFLYIYDSDRLQIKREFHFGGDFYPSFVDFDENGVKDILAFKRRNDSVFVEIQTMIGKKISS